MVYNLQLLISKVLHSWNSIKNIAFPDLEGTEAVINNQQPQYNNDVESSLNVFMNQLVSANQKRNEKYLLE